MIRTMLAVVSAVFAYVMVFGGVALAARSAFPQAHETTDDHVMVAEASPQGLRVQSDALLR